MNLLLLLLALGADLRDTNLSQPLGSVSQPITCVNCTGNLSATSDIGPQFSQGIVTAIEPRGFSFKVDSGFPLPGPGWSNVKVIPFDDDGSLTPCDTGKATAFTPVGDSIRVTMVGKLALKVGQHVALPNRKTPDAVYLRGCHDLTVDLTIYAGGNHGLTCVDCERLTVKVKVLPAPGRLLSTNADGVRFTNCRDMRAEITVEACGDDAFNSHGFVKDEKPGGWNERLYLTGKVANIYGGVKASGKAITIEDLEMTHCAGVLHLGADYGEPFDSGPVLEHLQVTIRGLKQDDVGFGKMDWPSLRWSRARGNVTIVAANLFREKPSSEPEGEAVHYLKRLLPR